MGKEESRTDVSGPNGRGKVDGGWGMVDGGVAKANAFNYDSGKKTGERQNENGSCSVAGRPADGKRKKKKKKTRYIDKLQLFSFPFLFLPLTHSSLEPAA